MSDGVIGILGHSGPRRCSLSGDSVVLNVKPLLKQMTFKVLTCNGGTLMKTQRPSSKAAPAPNNTELQSQVHDKDGFLEE